MGKYSEKELNDFEEILNIFETIKKTNEYRYFANMSYPNNEQLDCVGVNLVVEIDWMLEYVHPSCKTMEERFKAAQMESLYAYYANRHTYLKIAMAKRYIAAIESICDKMKLVLSGDHAVGVSAHRCAEYAEYFTEYSTCFQSEMQALKKFIKK